MNEISQDGRRTRHEPRKQDLLAAAVEYVFEHGFSELSIRPLAAALGISHRTLLYHFHSNTNLPSPVKYARLRKS
jgi:AcrR family transcriptional regulator